jgi:hypothetical protein
VTSTRGIVRAQDTVRALVATIPGGGGGSAARAEAPSRAISATARQARTPRIRAEDDAASRSNVCYRESSIFGREPMKKVAFAALLVAALVVPLGAAAG